MTSVRSVREGVSPRGGHRLRTATADCLGPTAAPAPRPTQPPQGAPTAAPSTAPTARPTTAPSSEPTTAAPSAAPTELCETTTYRSGVAISVPARRRPSSMTFAALARGRSTWQPPRRPRAVDGISNWPPRRRRERSTGYPAGAHGVAASGRRNIQLAPDCGLLRDSSDPERTSNSQVRGRRQLLGPGLRLRRNVRLVGERRGSALRRDPRGSQELV